MLVPGKGSGELASLAAIAFLHIQIKALRVTLVEWAARVAAQLIQKDREAMIFFLSKVFIDWWMQISCFLRGLEWELRRILMWEFVRCFIVCLRNALIWSNHLENLKSFCSCGLWILFYFLFKSVQILFFECCNLISVVIGLDFFKCAIFMFEKASLPIRAEQPFLESCANLRLIL